MVPPARRAGATMVGMGFLIRLAITALTLIVVGAIVMAVVTWLISVVVPDRLEGR